MLNYWIHRAIHYPCHSSIHSRVVVIVIMVQMLHPWLTRVEIAVSNPVNELAEISRSEFSIWGPGCFLLLTSWVCFRSGFSSCVSLFLFNFALHSIPFCTLGTGYTFSVVQEKLSSAFLDWWFECDSNRLVLWFGGLSSVSEIVIDSSCCNRECKSPDDEE